MAALAHGVGFRIPELHRSSSPPRPKPCVYPGVGSCKVDSARNGIRRQIHSVWLSGGPWQHTARLSVYTTCYGAGLGCELEDVLDDDGYVVSCTGCHRGRVSSAVRRRIVALALLCTSRYLDHSRVDKRHQELLGRTSEGRP